VIASARSVAHLPTTGAMPSLSAGSPPWAHAGSRPAHRGRRVALVLVVAALSAILVVAYAAIASLRNDAADARSAGVRMSMLRIELGALDALSWQGVALGAPDFTVQDGTRLHATRYRALLAGLAPSLSATSRARVVKLSAVYLGGIADVERSLKVNRPANAEHLAQVLVGGASDLLDSELRDDAHMLRAHAVRLDRRAETGTRWIVALAGVLIVVLLIVTQWVARRGQRARRDALALSERRFRSLVHNASDAIVVLDDDHRVLHATQAIHPIAGRDADELVGTEISTLVPVDEQRALRAALAALYAGNGKGEPTRWSVRRPDGELVYVESLATDLRDDPAVGAVVVNLRDITERRRMEQDLRHQAFHDALTGLPNRALFEDRLGQALARRRRAGVGVGLLLVDVDDFKAINDRLGHGTGDQVLQRIAACLDGERRAADTAARLGGDEFAVLVEDVADRAQLEAIASRLLASLRALGDAGDDEVALSVSVGAVLAHGDDASGESLLRDGDIALYAAKTAGKRQVKLFEPEMLDAERRRLRVRHDLAGAVARAELEVHYQPLFALGDDRLTGFEALVRWRHTELGLISPADFIPMAEETGDIVPIGRHVLERACADLAEWTRAGLAEDVTIGVNVSARQFGTEGFVADVLDVLGLHAVAPERLVIELTETALVVDVPATRERLAELRAAGVRIAVDDFGTGYSSLSYLRDLQLDVVKIDRSFVARVDERGQDATLVRSIIELGHALGLRMVAEGIERTAQLRLLTEAQCDVGQGFLFARPAPADVTTSMLAATRA
jgi:diguanylate cyclase (GGDEF)-like protein/PAS domain S-box-containing protein